MKSNSKLPLISQEDNLFDSFFDDLHLGGYESDSEAKNKRCSESRSISETKSMTSGKNCNFKFLDESENYETDFVIRNSLAMLDLGNGYGEQNGWKEGNNSYPSMLMPNNHLLKTLSCGPDKLSLIPTKKPIILDEREGRYTGRLKFFDENKNYGFIIKDDDFSDIFAHYEDLIKGGMTKEMLRSTKNGVTLRLAFSCMNYIGKYNKSRKAVDIQLIQNQL